MSRVNCARLEGRIAWLGDGRYLPSGDMAVEIRVALNEPGRKVEFIPVDFIGEPATVLQELAVVGQEIELEGRLRISKREGYPPCLKVTVDHIDGSFQLGHRPAAKPVPQHAAQPA